VFTAHYELRNGMVPSSRPRPFQR